MHGDCTDMYRCLTIEFAREVDPMPPWGNVEPCATVYGIV